MKKTLILLAILCFKVSLAQTPVTDGSDWTVTNITNDDALDFPWEITYAPDNNLWITERKGEKIVNYNTTTAAISTMIDLSSKIATSKQGGLMGMAIHPALYSNINTTTNNYVFASYTYDDAGTMKVRIVRMTYNNTTGLLTEDTTTGNANGSIIEGLPGSSDHNSGRLIFGPDLKLYYTIGDQGANQFEHACEPVLSQVLPNAPTDYDSYPGKTLRFETDGSVPTDNPTFNSVQSHVYTYGHRNAQGIVFAQDGTLYNSEHGAKVDDELNKVIAGKNYGWPEIAGYYDNMAYTYCDWSSLGGSCDASTFGDHNCPPGAITMTEFESFPTAAPADFVPPIGTYNSTTDTDPQGGFLSWPSIAPSSIDIHELGNIPNWGRSLLIPSLKRGTIFRAKLTPNGNAVEGDFYEEFHSSNDRYRDIAISPDGLTIYAITDNSGGTSGPSSGGFVSISNPGVIIKIEYVGTTVPVQPVANCQDITVELDAFSNATITAADIDNGSTNFDAISIDVDTFNCSHIGTPQTVYLTVTTTAGGEDTCAATVTVIQTTDALTAPTLDDITGYCEVTASAPILTYKCVDYTGTTTNNTTYTSGTNTIQWEFNAGVEGTVFSNQNVIVDALAIPNNISVTESATSAEITWDALNGATYSIRYKETTASVWTVITATINTVTLNGLSTETDYEVQVRSECTASQSDYSSSTNFTTTALMYCTPLVDFYPDDFYISNVRLKTASNNEILNHTTNQNDDVEGYSNHTNDGTTVPDLNAGFQYTIDITLLNSHPWNKTTGHSVWIDYNVDGDFDDAGERVWGTTEGDDLFNHGEVANGSFTIPNGLLPGNRRMRIASRTYYTGSDPCHLDFDNNNGGEFEDYTINILNPTLSIQENSLVNFSIYPNPVENIVNIALPLNYNYEQLTVRLLDIQGRVIRNKIVKRAVNTITFNNLNSLSKGVYFININDGNSKTISKKLIKM